jgi:putative redox protein
MVESWREVVTEWKGGNSFIGRNAAGGNVQIGIIDDRPGIGPMELLLVGLAGCTGMDIVSILTKKRQVLDNFQVIVRGKRADTYPQVFTEIQVNYILWGDRLDPKAIEQAIQLSEDKYCSASAMLGKVAQISSSYKILKPGEIYNEISKDNL